MAKLSTFIYCLNTEKIVAPDGKGESVNAHGILSNITPEFIPGSYSFSIIFTLLGIDVSKSNLIRIQFGSTNGEENLVDTGDISLPPHEVANDYGFPKEYRGLTMSMDIRNVVLKNEGLYNTVVTVNGESFSDNEIYVKGKQN